MRNVLAIIRKELYSFVFSPTVWVVFAVFLLIIGWMFYGMTAYFSDAYQQYQQQQQYMRGMGNMTFNLNQRVVAPMLGNMAVVLLLLLPVITMRLLAEEQSMGTIELLLTRPVTVTQLVAGKYLAALAVMLAMIGCTALFPFMLSLYGTLDMGPVYTGYLGVALLGASFLALGLFASSLTRSQVVAAALGFGGNLLFWIVSWISASMESEASLGSKVLAHLSIISHFENPAKGVLASVDIVYYLSFIAFFLFLTHRVVDSMRWR